MNDMQLFFNIPYTTKVQCMRIYFDDKLNITNVKLLQSHHIKRHKDKRKIIEQMFEEFKLYGLHYDRTIRSCVDEWSAHNILYRLGIFRERTADADLDTNQKWYYKVGYFILGLIGRNL